jgi:hypothetical protein
MLDLQGVLNSDSQRTFCDSCSEKSPTKCKRIVGPPKKRWNAEERLNRENTDEPQSKDKTQNRK